MSTLKKIVAIAAIVMGVIFFINGGSDIQLGFGSVLVAMGILNL